jgi:hypothetical protein
VSGDGRCDADLPEHSATTCRPPTIQPEHRTDLNGTPAVCSGTRPPRRQAFTLTLTVGAPRGADEAGRRRACPLSGRHLDRCHARPQRAADRRTTPETGGRHAVVRCITEPNRLCRRPSGRRISRSGDRRARLVTIGKRPANVVASASTPTAPAHGGGQGGRGATDQPRPAAGERALDQAELGRDSTFAQKAASWSPAWAARLYQARASSNRFASLSTLPISPAMTAARGAAGAIGS